LPAACSLLLVCLAFFPFLTNELKRSQHRASIAGLRHEIVRSKRAEPVIDPRLSLRVARLSGLLASWETVGGCGAGSSTGAGGGIKWIGRSASGGLFQLQSIGTYTHLQNGYNLALNTLVNRDIGEKWNVGFSVPLLYKYYRDYYGLPVDISNAGVGDVAAFVTRRFGEINDTSLSLLVGFPTGTYRAKYKGDPLTQEKQLGAGALTASLTLDHTLDETWGLIVLGGSFGWRGGENSAGNYRAPVGSIYGYAGYFAGPFVPSIGVGLTRFFGIDRDRGLNQLVQLMALTGTVSIEWSTDWIAILGGFSVPYGWESHGSVQGGENSNMPPGIQPWTVALGVTISPF